MKTDVEDLGGSQKKLVFDVPPEEVKEEIDKYCKKPLELDDIEIREALFRHYQRLLYLRQPSDPDLMPQACRIAEFLGLRLETANVDYSFLDRQIVDLIQAAEEGSSRKPHDFTEDIWCKTET